MTLPLFERYPGTATLALAGIADLPTPTADVPSLLARAGAASLGVKRDDLTSAIYGGNKVRKLDFLLGDALAKGAKAVITFGAYGSNHALATAIHASALGLEPHVILSPQEPGPFAAATLLAHAAVGTVIYPIEGWDGRREAVRAKRELEARDGVKPYVIPGGGTSILGVVGYANAALEVESSRAPDAVYVAAGTLGTAVGLALGFAAAGSSTRVIAIRVTPTEICNLAIARELAEQTVAFLHALDPGFPHLSFDELRLELRDDWFEPGYGVVTPEGTEAVSAAALEGIKLETTYTGKALAALLADGGSGELAGLDVVFWDTYSSVPKPASGAIEALPPALQAYVRECIRLFGPPR